MKIQEIRRCYDCGEEVEEKSIGTEGFTVCSSCRNVEGETYISYEDEQGAVYTEAEYLAQGDAL